MPAARLQQETTCQFSAVSPILTAMITVEEIERAVEELPPSDVARLAAWLAEYDAKVWDKQMEEDSAAGRLDFLFEEARSERKAGKLRDWPSEQGKA